MTPSILRFAAAGLAFAGCATVDPSGTFSDTREAIAARHPGELVWARDETAREAADARVRVLLSAPLDAERAAELALLRNPALQATLESLGIAQAELAQASRLSNPGVSWSRLTGSGATLSTASITADLVDWLVRPLRKTLAEAELEHTKLEVGHAVLETAAEARLAFLELQAADSVVALMGRVTEVDEAALDYAQALFDAGNLTALDLASARAESLEAKAHLRRARAAAAGRREAVRRALGLSGAEVWAAEPGLAPPLDTVDTAPLEEAAVTERLDLAAARWAVTTLESALALRRKTRLLPVGVEIGIERERETDGLELTGPVVELRLPIFDTGKASVARLEAELSRARWQLVALEAAVRSRIRELGEELEANGEIARLYRDDVLPLRREVLARSLAEYNQMLIGTFELLAAKKAETESELASIEALAGYWRARFALELALGLPLPAAPAPTQNEHSGPSPHEHHEHSGPTDSEEHDR